MNGDTKIKGIWRNAVLIEELVTQEVLYDRTGRLEENS